MTTFYIIVGVIITAAIVAKMYGALESSYRKSKVVYKYKKAESIMTPAEQDFYKTLGIAAGQDYVIFAQVHLPNLIDHKVFGQDWNAAFRHINGKSVDFVLCDKITLEPKLAIELDDKTHSRSDRKESDSVKNVILRDAGVKLLRFPNHGSFNSQEISEKIRWL